MIKRILKEGIIEILTSDLGEKGMSNEVHVVKHDGKKYVLRICKNKSTADYYISIYKKFSKYNFLPKLLGQKGRKILFEYIEGRDCNKEDALKVAYQIGEIVGRINKINLNKEEKFNPNKKFDWNLRLLKRKKLIDKITFEKILEKYTLLTKKAKLKICLDASDIIPDNFRINKGKVYLVDIEMIRPDIKSRGIAKSFLKWFVNEKQRENFKKGYNSVDSAKFLTKNYIQLIYLYFLVMNIKSKMQNRLSNKKNKERLKLFLEGKLK